VRSGEWTGPELKEQGIVEKHYGALAQRALFEDPAGLELDEAAKQKFETTFGTKWMDALAAGKICNLTEALKRLGTMNEIQIATAWRAGGSTKLLPGTYVAKVEDLFVINGFYGDMVSSWKQDSARVLFYLVQWKEGDLRWSDFRLKVIGSTDPEKADPASIRGVLLKEYQTKFSLGVKPTTTLNGVHASAGSIEGTRECGIWAKSKASHLFLLEQAAKTNNVSNAVWKRAMDNDKVELKNGKKGLVFDVTEGMSATEALEVLKELSAL